MKGKPIERTYLKVVFNTYFGMCYYYVCKTYIFLNLSYLKRKSKKKFFLMTLTLYYMTIVTVSDEKRIVNFKIASNIAS